MTVISLIAAVARNGVIGRAGSIPWRLPGEQADFKATTLGHTLVMGRATYDSIGRPLPGRRTIVVTRDREWRRTGVEVAHSLPEALALAGPADMVFIAGGAQLYAEALPFAQRMILTEVDAEPDGDTWFPEVADTDWQQVAREERAAYEIVTYERRG